MSDDCGLQWLVGASVGALFDILVIYFNGK